MIIEGWTNRFFKKDAVEVLAKERMKICEDCWWHSKHHITPLRVDVHCTECGCTLAAKVRSPHSACPKDKWQAVEL